MKRREFFQAMMAASVTAGVAGAQQTAPSVAQTAPPAPKAPGPLPWMRGLMEVKPLRMTPLAPDAVAATEAHFFSATQMATLRRLCQVLQPPRKRYPGAAEAGTPEFLDFLIGASPAARRQMYQSGLDRLEAEARRDFGVSFAEADAGQVDRLLRPWLRTWMSDHPPAEEFAQFINLAHSDIRTATMNSQAWSEAALAAGQPIPNVDLYWYPVDPEVGRT